MGGICSRHSTESVYQSQFNYKYTVKDTMEYYKMKSKNISQHETDHRDENSAVPHEMVQLILLIIAI